MLQDICGSQEKAFVVNHPKKPIVQYTLQVGDECIVAPLSLFTPELFGVTGPKLVHTQRRSNGDPEDPHDENYLRETSVIIFVLFSYLNINKIRFHLLFILFFY